MWTRRGFSRLLALPVLGLHGQGVATRNVTPVPRGKPSGLPFHAHFTDIAEQAGLHAPVILGDSDHKSWILETAGCGAAFIDYDNDGWLDIFILSGTNVQGSPDATNRLYQNNRDGTFTDVTEKAGLRRPDGLRSVAVGDYNNDGFDDIFITYWGQNVLYRNNGDGTFTDVTKGLACCNRESAGVRDAPLSTTTATATWISSSPITSNSTSSLFPNPGANTNCNWKGVPV